MIAYNGSNGVGIVWARYGNTIDNDYISLNGSNGVYFAGASGNSVVGCTIEANQAWGILDQGATTTTLTTQSYNNIDGSIGYRTAHWRIDRRRSASRPLAPVVDLAITIHPPGGDTERAYSLGAASFTFIMSGLHANS